MTTFCSNVVHDDIILKLSDERSYCLLGCGTYYTGRSLPTFRRSMLSPSSGLNSSISSIYQKFVIGNISHLCDVRESANDCTFASGEGYSSCGETFHPIYGASPVSSATERSVILNL
jgi:hypothetical protein